MFAQIRVWNYNKTAEDVYRGIRQGWVYIDGTLVRQPLNLRAAPGNTLFDYGQLIRFTTSSAGMVQLLLEFPSIALSPLRSAVADRPLVQQDYETPTLPCGQLVKVER